MTIFTAAFAAVSASAAQDVFEIVAPADSRVRLRECRIGQYSDAGDAQDELLSVQIIRGHTVTGSGGGPVTPANLEPWSRAAAATVAINNTGLATTSGVLMLSDSFNVRAGWIWDPVEEECIWLRANERAVIRITAPADGITLNGTLVFEETGQVPQ